MLSAEIDVQVSESFRLTADLDIASGVTALVGPSGAGKSTVLQVLSGLRAGRRNDRVKVRFEDIVWQDGSTFVPPHKRSVGYVFQQPQLFPHLSVEQNLRYGESRSRDPRIRFTDVAGWLDLESLFDRRINHLSGGEAQRVAIGRALLASPRILLMDEPLGSIDEAARLRILPYLSKLRAVLDIPVVYVTHAMLEVGYLADTVFRLEAGRVVDQGSVFDMNAGLGTAEPAAVIELPVASYDDAFGLAEFPLGSSTLYVASAPVSAGTRVRVRIPARDVSVSTVAPGESSILNVFEARITAIDTDHSRPAATLALAVDGGTLMASITRKSLNALSLEVGQLVFAQIKGVALLTDHGR